MPSGGGLRELFGQAALAVIDRRVETERVEKRPGLARSAGRTDHPGGAQLPGQLPGDAADRPGRGGDEDDIALAHRRGTGECRVRGQPRGAQRSEVRGRRRERGVGDGCRRRVEDRVFTPAQEVGDGRPDRYRPGPGGDHLTDGPAVEGGTESEGRNVGGSVVHAAAHVGVHGHPGVADHDLSLTRLGHLGGDQLEVLRRRLADGTGGEPDFAGQGCGGAGGVHGADSFRCGRRAARCDRTASRCPAVTITGNTMRPPAHGPLTECARPPTAHALA